MYLTLYRKYRPQLFGQVIGQDISVRIITNSILNQTFSHSYLFIGTRGTGKTTVARIFAKALNCLDRDGFEPCNGCSNCVAFNSGSFPDCVEIDAASNRGINEIKQLRENLKLAPLKGRYKVYIIDEVHMLTIEAFNALLKSLEEPPSSVIFILATTDVHKVPITIQSRCQKIEFKRVNHNIIFNHLKDICFKEGIRIDDDALLYLSKAANGSVRDSLSLLEQVRNISDHIKLTDIWELFSIVSMEWVYEYIKFVITGDILKLIELMNKIKFHSVNIYQFIYLIVSELKNCIYYKYRSYGDEFSSFQIEKYKDILSISNVEQIRKLMNLLSNILNYYKSDNDYILFEINSINMVFDNYSKLSKDDVLEQGESSSHIDIREKNDSKSLKDVAKDSEVDKISLGKEQDSISVSQTKFESVKERLIKIFDNDKLLSRTISNAKDVFKEDNKLVFVFQLEKKSEIAYRKLIEQKSNSIIQKLKDIINVDTIEFREMKIDKSKSSRSTTIDRVIDYTRRI
ncbi:MAG: DNA polymerase III subunit gamma/tau [Candidatus Calescibacterium sp.]|nr:DNA polymerase III subunit gamma/tau [Candidatus Calescibacterium sp.]MDW8132581.1 DNA polymerase III subunit gamma/tau [Candidatus Calescibacterium sp.]